jgi:dihydropteroate synthase
MTRTVAAPKGIPDLKPGARPYIMGILNATPDSFYADSRVSGDAALKRGLEMLEDGADALDIGGESTRPGSEAIKAKDEMKRVLPLIKQLAKKTKKPISIDTSKPEVAKAALDAGATVLNDVFGLRSPGMMEVALKFPTVIVMHMLGENPKSMQEKPFYVDVVEDIADFFKGRVKAFKDAGGDAERLWLDPGIGFGKTRGHNEEIFQRLEDFGMLGRPLVIGASRKSFIGRIHGSDDAPLPVEERLEGSLAAACRAAEGGAACLRVHDVAATRRTLEVWQRLAA